MMSDGPGVLVRSFNIFFSPLAFLPCYAMLPVKKLGVIPRVYRGSALDIRRARQTLALAVRVN